MFQVQFLAVVDLLPPIFAHVRDVAALATATVGLSALIRLARS